MHGSFMIFSVNFSLHEQSESPQTKGCDEKNDGDEEERLRKIAEQVGTDLLDFAKGKATSSNILEILSGISKASENENGTRGNVSIFN